ncbi:FG-GAP and VCBS repeat-containing protein [Streptomyces katsurahamanus]|uniref:FG-GAP and VCBS repeat-containing protein n=1 Tax=Streptomyces katsurahamanus TaxID=2577098 RepID=UPI001E471770|nr:FG-GAP and VCBS repeat-containing protein [Streptomyces katsurahamanus]
MSTRTALRLALATATAASLTGGLLAVSTGAATAAAKPAAYADDFNGDGFRDYATPGLAGFTVTYGTAKGPGTKSRSFTQDSPGIPGKAGGDGEEWDSFGRALANADFNGDGYADLAVGDMSEKVGKRSSRGAVTIVWGSKSGLGSKATLIPAGGKPKADRYFGMALATGDFNGDGKADLAVSDAYSVYVYRGGFSSKTGGTGKVTQHRPGGGSDFSPFGLVAGQVTKDKATDLYVLGAESEGDFTMRSVAWFLQGGATVKPGASTTYAVSDWLSTVAVVADFDRDGYGDLAIGDPSHRKDAGAVTVVRGGKSGPAGSYRLTQSTKGVATAATKGDSFGGGISAGDVDKDGYPDLAVSASGEKVGKAENAGGVHILRGGAKGLTGARSQWFTRATPGVPGEPRENVPFGESLRLRDLDQDGYADLLASEFATKSQLLPGGKDGIGTAGTREVRLSADFVE